MPIKLLIRRTFTRQPTLYIKLFIMLTLSVMMLMNTLIIRDSERYGARTEVLEKSGGYDYIVEPVSEDELYLFSEVPGWEYLDGKVGIILPSGANPSEVSYKLSQRLKEAGSGAMLTSYRSLKESAEFSTFATLMVGVLIFAAGVALVSIWLMYAAYLDTRRADIGTLYSLGAGMKQVRAWLRRELLVLTAAALVLGILLSAVFMFAVIRLCLTDLAGVTPILYRFSPLSMLLVIGMTLGISMAVISLHTRRLAGMSPSELLADTHIPRSSKELRDGRSLEGFFTSASLFRDKKHNRICLFATMPLMVLGIVVSAHFGMYTPEDSARRLGDVQLYVTDSEVALHRSEAEALLNALDPDGRYILTPVDGDTSDDPLIRRMHITFADKSVCDSLLTSEQVQVYKVKDFRAQNADYVRLYAGFGVFFIVFGLCIYADAFLLLATYIGAFLENRRRDILLLGEIGCEERRIVRLYMTQYAVRGGLAILAALPLGLALTGVMSVGLAMPVLPNLVTILPPVLIVALFAAAYVLASMRTTRQIIAEG
ncbi:MAG: FtsX-like permease family protein [Clostridia bacterium]|nr:FtsX-like permease family protein [Clostridia bacterium]